MKVTWLCAALSGLEAVDAVSTFSPVRPPAIPLAVRNPYMNAWQESGSPGNGGYLPGQWPVLWNGNILGWTGIIRVDNQTYTWLGQPSEVNRLANQLSVQYTATKSIFTLAVGNMVRMNVTFLSPVEANDLKRQSLPYSYMDVTVQSLDGKNHKVQLYSDITAEWVSGNRLSVAQWDYGTIRGGQNVRRSNAKKNAEVRQRSEQAAAVKREPQVSAQAAYTTYGTRTTYSGWTTAVSHSIVPGATRPVTTPASSNLAAVSSASARPHNPKPSNPAPGGIAFHQVYKQAQQVFSENTEQAEWGNWYYSTTNSSALTFQSGPDGDVRGQFVRDGYLQNTEDTNFRAINDTFPTFGFAIDLGTVGAQNTTNTMFMLSLHQHQAIMFEGAGGNTSLPALWTSYWGNDLEAIQFAFNDFSYAQTHSATIDSRVAADSTRVAGSNYNVLTSLAYRQAFGATELVGTPSNVLMFMKEISSDGNVNTVDVIFPLHPILMYENPELLRYLLDPLFINQEAGFWPQAYPIHDIGSHFPNATGHNSGDAEQQPLEEGGNMLIMALAYAQITGNNQYLRDHYPILRQWNEYLIQEALIPADQISTDDFAGSLANQTNLALKGMIGIAAMGQISKRVGNNYDARNYTAIAKSYIKQWYTLGIAQKANPPHTTLAYGMNETWGLLYNLFGDRYLGLNLVKQSVYDMQSAYYPTVENNYGVPLDTRHAYTKSDWEVWCAAIASNSTRDMFINDIAQWIGQTQTNLPVTDLYDTITGDFAQGVTFIGRPVVGGWFALLLLDKLGRL